MNIKQIERRFFKIQSQVFDYNVEIQKKSNSDLDVDINFESTYSLKIKSVIHPKQVGDSYFEPIQVFISFNTNQLAIQSISINHEIKNLIKTKKALGLVHYKSNSSYDSPPFISNYFNKNLNIDIDICLNVFEFNSLIQILSMPRDDKFFFFDGTFLGIFENIEANISDNVYNAIELGVGTIGALTEYNLTLNDRKFPFILTNDYY